MRESVPVEKRDVHSSHKETGVLARCTELSVGTVFEIRSVDGDADLKPLIPNEEVFGIQLAKKIKLLATEPDEVGITR